MTNKLVVIISSLKVPKIKKMLLYEMKFLVPNYSCLQNPWLGGCRPQIPFLSVLNWICWPPPPNKIPGYATDIEVFVLSVRENLLDWTVRPCRGFSTYSLPQLGHLSCSDTDELYCPLFVSVRIVCNLLSYRNCFYFAIRGHQPQGAKWHTCTVLGFWHLTI